VVVANKDIKEKSVISLNDLAKKNIPKKFVLQNSIVLGNNFDHKQLAGKIALTDIYADEQITLKRVAAAENSPWLSPSVPQNHRALTIPSNSLSYIKPSDHIDLFISIRDPKNRSRVINTPVLQNVAVLAVDGKYKVTAADPFTNGN